MNPQVHMLWGSLPAAVLPRTWAEAIADRAGDLACHLAGEPRRNVQRNLSCVLGAQANAALVRGAFRTYARYYLGVMRLAYRDPLRAVGHVRWLGAEGLAASLQRGRGVLVLSAHLGNWDVAGLALAARFGGLCVFVEPLQPAVLFRFYRRVRERHGVRVVAAGAASRVPLEVLRGNGLLGLVADRSFGVRRERVPCGTGELVIPAGGIRLALRAGAAIHPVFALREPGGFVVRAGEDLAATVRSLPDEPARLRRIGTAFAEELQQAVRRHPEQWCLLHPMSAFDAPGRERRGAA